MKQEELVKGLTYLGTAFGKEYSKMEAEIYYDFLKDYNYETFIKAIKSIIKTNKFLPKINEIMEECEANKNVLKNEVVEFMRERGYFKNSKYGDIPIEQQQRNYEKTLKFIELNIVPEWLQEDINTYYKIMKQPKLENKEVKYITNE